MSFLSKVLYLFKDEEKAPEPPSSTPEPTPEPEPTYTDVTILLDRSSSMVDLMDAVVLGFNDQFRKMRENPGNNRWSLVEFDDRTSAYASWEEFPNVAFSQVSEANLPYLEKPPNSWGSPVPGCPDSVIYRKPRYPIVCSGVQPHYFMPRGGTALVDAMYKTVESIEARLSGKTNVRPVVMVFTDGKENNSHEHSSQELRELITRVQEKGFEFLYLGANQDSFTEAQKYGLHTNMGIYSSVPPKDGGIDPATASCVNNFESKQSWLNQTTGGALVGYTDLVSGVIASGAIGQAYTSYICSGAILSGFVGLYNFCSGAISSREYRS